MTFFGPPDVKQLKARQNVRGLMRALTYKSRSWEHRHIRRAAATALGELQDLRAVEPLIAAVIADDVILDVTTEAAIALGQLKDARAVDALIGALPNHGAAEALGHLHDTRAVQPLCYLIQDKLCSLLARKAAAHSLGNLRDVRAVETLVATFRECEWELITIAAEALVKIGKPAVEPLITLLSDGDYRIPLAKVARTLGQIGDAHAITPLIALLKHRDASVRKAVAEVLPQLGWVPTGEAGVLYWMALEDWTSCRLLGSVAIDPLTAALYSGDFQLSYNAALTLSKIKHPRAIEVLVCALQDPQLQDKRPLLKVAGWLHDKRVIEPLVNTLHCQSVECRSLAATALGEIPDASVVAPLVEELYDEVWEVRKAAAESLVQLYRSPRLPATEKQQILNVRDIITAPYQGEYVFQNTSDQYELVSNQGIGVNFPQS